MQIWWLMKVYMLTCFRNQSSSQQGINDLENAQNDEKVVANSAKSKIISSIKLNDISDDAIEMAPLNSTEHSLETPDIPITPSTIDKDKYNGKIEGGKVTSVALNTSQNDDQNVRKEKSNVKLDEETKQVVN